MVVTLNSCGLFLHLLLDRVMIIGFWLLHAGTKPVSTTKAISSDSYIFIQCIKSLWITHAVIFHLSGREWTKSVGLDVCLQWKLQIESCEKYPIKASVAQQTRLSLYNLSSPVPLLAFLHNFLLMHVMETKTNSRSQPHTLTDDVTRSAVTPSSTQSRMPAK